MYKITISESIYNELKVGFQNSLDILEHNGLVITNINNSVYELSFPSVENPRLLYFGGFNIDIDTGAVITSFTKSGPFISYINFYDEMNKKNFGFDVSQFKYNLENAKLSVDGSNSVTISDLLKMEGSASYSSSFTKQALVKNGLLASFSSKDSTNLEDIFHKYLAKAYEIWDAHDALVIFLNSNVNFNRNSECEDLDNMISEERVVSKYYEKTMRMVKRYVHYVDYDMQSLFDSSWIVDNTVIEGRPYYPDNSGVNRSLSKTEIKFSNAMELLSISKKDYDKVYSELSSKSDSIKEVIKKSSLKDIVKGSYLTGVIRKGVQSIVGKSGLSSVLPNDIKNYSVINKRYIILLKSLIAKL